MQLKINTEKLSYKAKEILIKGFLKQN